MGVLGLARMDPECLEEELNWIDDQIDGKPYGIDVLMSGSVDDGAVTLTSFRRRNVPGIILRQRRLQLPIRQKL